MEPEEPAPVSSYACPHCHRANEYEIRWASTSLVCDGCGHLLIVDERGQARQGDTLRSGPPMAPQ